MNVEAMNQFEITRLRGELQICKCRGEDDNIVTVARNNAALARKLRELRGHADLFKIETKSNSN